MGRIRITGMNSGLDTDSMVKELVNAYEKQGEKYTKAKTKTEWKQEAWTTLNNKIKSFFTKQASNMRFSSAYSKKKTTVSDSSKASVIASNSAVNGTQTLEVKELAKSAYLTSGEITVKDENGKDLSLSDLKGKHVVIDFWGTWCPWCVKGIPEMKASYEKYSDKLEIVSVDCGDKEGDWKDAIKEHEMTWKNVFDGNNEVVEKYEIQGFPTKIVLDPDGKILKVFVGESEDFYKYLDETLKI